jgi:hypothetical protein
MFRRILRSFGFAGRKPLNSPLDLPAVARSDVAHFFHITHDLPQVDWAMADAWIRTRSNEPAELDRLRRGVAAAWLDELRDALRIDHRRWRTSLVEGLAPLEGTIGKDVADAAERSFKIVSSALAKIRGDEPAHSIAIIALAADEDYYSLLAHYYPEEGEWGTSGGTYHRGGAEEFPAIILPVKLRWGVDRTIAHELTHHLLADRGLPLWVEEGLTQMMEERVTGGTTFALNRELIQRHRRRWSEVGLSRFWSGEAFGSPSDDEQELAYHLAEALTRGLLAKRASAYFAFARAASDSDGGEAAAREHLGQSLTSVAAGILGPEIPD